MTAPAPAASQADELAMLLVEVGDLHCGLPADDVVELHPVVATVALPGAPPGIDGAIDVRGTVVAVLDLRTTLGIARREPLLSDHLAICRVGPRTMALRVDRAVDLVGFPRATIDSADYLYEGRHLRGVVKLGDGLVLIYDLASFLSADEASALDHALDGIEVDHGGRC